MIIWLYLRLGYARLTLAYLRWDAQRLRRRADRILAKAILKAQDR